MKYSDEDKKRVIDFYSVNGCVVSIHKGYVVVGCNFRDHQTKIDRINRGDTNGFMLVETAIRKIKKTEDTYSWVFDEALANQPKTDNSPKIIVTTNEVVKLSNMRRKSYRIFTTEGSYMDMAYSVKDIIKGFDKDHGVNTTPDIIAIVEVSDRGIKIQEEEDTTVRDRHFVIFYDAVFKDKAAYGSISITTRDGSYISLDKILTSIKLKSPKMTSAVPTSITELSKEDFITWSKQQNNVD